MGVPGEGRVVRREHAIEGLADQRRATLALLADLPAEAWEAPCLPPWRVRDVVAHLVAIDTAAVTGRLLPLLRAAGGRDDVERWNDRVVGEADDGPPLALLAELDRAGERLVAVAARLPAPAWRLPVRTVFGRHPLVFLPARRVLDEWVHGVDIARAAGIDRAGHVPRPDLLATAVLDALPTLVLPALTAPGSGLTAGVVRLVVGTGALDDDGEHVPRRTWSVDVARRHYGPRVTATPDATLRLHAAALALLVERRPVGAYGPVVVEGDAALGSRLRDSLAGG
jgi:uncharacterized protein (TIGR03083 family)